MRQLYMMILAVAACLSAGVSRAYAGVADDQEDVYFILSGEADRAISDGDYQTAVQRIKEALAVAPDNPQNVMLLSNLGIIYNYMDEDSLAMSAFDQALSIAPSMTVVLENRGRLRLKTGDRLGAINDFNRVIGRDSTNVTARFYHGLMSLYGGDRDTAETDFAILSDREPDGYLTCVAMSTLYTMTGREHDAIPYYKRLIDLEDDAEYYAALAGCYLAESELSEAAAIIDSGLQKHPEAPDLYYYRAWLNRDRYLLREAKADAARAVQLGADPRRVAALFDRKN